MGWRWRKVINLNGGIRAIISRNGVGWSWGVPGFRIGKAADGSNWISAGIPGTGLYFTKRLSKTNKQIPQISDQGPGEEEAPQKTVVKRWKNIK